MNRDFLESQWVARSNTVSVCPDSLLLPRFISQHGKRVFSSRGADNKSKAKAVILSAGGVPLAARARCTSVHLCAMTGWAKPVVAPLLTERQSVSPSPACLKRSWRWSPLPQVLCFGPTAILSKRRPPAHLEKYGSPQIGIDPRSPLLRRSIPTRAWLGAANPLVWAGS